MVDPTLTAETKPQPVVPWRQSPPAPRTAEALESARRSAATVSMPFLDWEAIETASPEAYRATQRFQQAASRGRGTRGDFFALVRLLNRTGCHTAAEYFLRSNLLVSEEDGQALSVDDAGLDLYAELFGTARHQEFAA